MSPGPLCLEKWGDHDPPAPMGAPPLVPKAPFSFTLVYAAHI